MTHEEMVKAHGDYYFPLPGGVNGEESDENTPIASLITPKKRKGGSMKKASLESIIKSSSKGVAGVAKASYQPS